MIQAFDPRTGEPVGARGHWRFPAPAGVSPPHR